MSTTFYDESAFAEAWARGVQLAGTRFFTESGTPQDDSPKWRSCPDVEQINANLGVLSRGEAVFLAALCSFYNSESGGRMLSYLGYASPGAVSAALDEQRRRVIADLTVSYAGW